MNKHIYTKGTGLLEVIVAVAILGVALGSVVVTFSFYIRAALQNTEVIQATYLAEEGLEAVRIMRDTSWSSNVESLTLNTPYYLTYATSTMIWSANSTPENNYVDGKFMRTLSLGEVRRDGNDDIVSSGGSVDAESRLVNVTVSWSQRGATTSRSLSMYLTNIFDN